MKCAHRFLPQVAVVWVLLCAASTGAAQQAELTPPAQQISHELSKLKLGSAVVFTFSGPTKDGTQLGRHLADEFMVSLTAAGTRVLEREKLDPIVQENGLRWDELHDLNVACWVSKEAGADSLISGYLDSTPDSVSVTIKAYETKSGKEIMHTKVKIPFTEKIRSLLAQPLASPSEERPTEPQDQIEIEGMPVAGKGGVSHAACKECGPPEYTPKAREAKYQCTVVLRALITPEGRAADIRVVKGAGFGLTDKAIEAVKKWRFKPATGPKGDPLSAWANIEISFRIL